MRESNFFVFNNKTIGKHSSIDTLRCWIKDMMKDTGIDTSIFSDHSTKSASSSKEARYLSLSTIVKTIGWSREATFSTYYNKPVSKLQFADAVLAKWDFFLVIVYYRQF